MTIEGLTLQMLHIASHFQKMRLMMTNATRHEVFVHLSKIYSVSPGVVDPA